MKQHVMRNLWIVILLLVAGGLMGFAPFQVEPPPIEAVAPGTSVTEAILALAVQFAALVGTAGLSAAIVNVGKVFKLVTDGNSGRWYAGVSILAFSALVYFHVFRGIDLMVLDTEAARIAGILVFAGGLFAQLGIGQYIYDILRKLGLPLVSASFGQPGLPATPSK